MTRIELVADLQPAALDLASRLVDDWVAADPSGALIERATFVLPAGAAEPCEAAGPGIRLVPGPVTPEFWEAILSAAGREQRPVAALLTAVQPCCEAIGVMLDLLESDPMLGAAAARVQCTSGCCIQSATRFDGTSPEWIPHAALGDMQPYELIGELLAPCTLLTPLLLADLGDTEASFESLAGVVLQRLIAARRCGFRQVVANRAVVRVPGADCAADPAGLVPLPSSDARRLRTLDADAARGWCEFRGASNELFERQTARHLNALAGACRPSLLLDMRNVRATFNGTTFAAIGAAWGLYQEATGWDVAVLAHPEGIAFHDLESTFPTWTILTSPPAGVFNVALRLSQPWDIEQMIDLHRAARINAYLMLDTIAWDVVYAAPPHLDATWRFLAASADGLLFISDFSRQRFRIRFPRSPSVPQAVCHLSFDPDEYTRQQLTDTPAGNHILVVGNHLDHKDVSRTVEALACAFPFEAIEALGPSPMRSPRIRTHASGNLAELDVHRLYAGAKLVVFPSFYEGFGFPIVTALAYGRTLLARESPLLREVAGHCAPRGRLIAFRQRDDLVDIIGRLLHDERVPEMEVGAALGLDPPRAWRQVGADIDSFLRQLMRDASTTAWRARSDLAGHAAACWDRAGAQ